MLISPIDRNKEPEPEKHISRINSPYWTMPSSIGPSTSQKYNPSHSGEGVILRVRDTRLMERRKQLSPPELPEQERRQRNNRKHAEDPDNHHILVIALDRKAGEPDPWKAGDRVSVVFKPQSPAPTTQDNAPPETNKSPLLTKDEGDYVLHLSKDSPPER
jgi:hypothetical protein